MKSSDHRRQPPSVTELRVTPERTSSQPAIAPRQSSSQTNGRSLPPPPSKPPPKPRKGVPMEARQEVPLLLCYIYCKCTDINALLTLL